MTPESAPNEEEPEKSPRPLTDEEWEERDEKAMERFSRMFRRLRDWAKLSQPGNFQKKVIWGALTLASLAIIGILLAALLWLVLKIIDTLQPILIPLAAAGVLAYILDPFVEKWSRSRLGRKGAATVVVLLLSLIAGILVLIVIIPAIGQTVELYKHRDEIQSRVIEGWSELRTDINQRFGGMIGSGEEDWVGTWLKDKDNVSYIVKSIATWLSDRLQSVPALLIWLVYPILIPFFLWNILANTKSIGVHWHEWLPLRASQFKSELVDTLEEISSKNLKPYFRGQMLVSVINAVLTGSLLVIFGLDHAVLIACCMIFLGLIPMIGITLCAVPAIVIAFLQFTDPAERLAWGFDHVWVYPLIVLAIFVLVQQIDGWFITPRVIGASTGLSDFEVILSILFWSQLLGGFLGALLAVPLTSCVKVLHKRYIRQINSKETLPEPVPAD